MTKWMIALLAAGALLAGCNKDGGKSGDGSTAASADSIGVTECDDYLKKMESCLGKMPAQAKAASEAAFKQNRDAWKQAASTPAGKEGLKTACKAALDAIAQNPMCK